MLLIFGSVLFKYLMMNYSRVPNKRGGAENNPGGLEMVRYNSNQGGWNNRGVLGEIENSPFLRQTRICYISMCIVMLLIHILLNSGSVECTS